MYNFNSLKANQWHLYAYIAEVSQLQCLSSLTVFHPLYEI